MQFALMLLRYHNRPVKVIMKPSFRLKRIAKEVDFADQQAIVDVLRKLHNSLQSQKYGMKLGMAAPQIGINKRIFIYMSKGTMKAVINPSFRPANAPLTPMIESCYSLGENVFYKVERAPYGWAHYYGLNGIPVEEKLNGIEAIVFQHELSHLDGKCSDDLGIKLEK